AFRDARRGVAVGGDYQRPAAGGANLAITRDGGVTWHAPDDPGLEGVMYGIAHVQGSIYVAVGPAGSFLSRDDGQSWRRLGREGFNTVTFEGRTGWAAGPGGRIAGIRIPESGEPALVVLVAVDQLRPDYLDRHAAQWTGGFARLLAEGSVFRNGRQDHALTATAPGHATMLSGRVPAHTGIVSNALGVNSGDWPLLGSTGPGASPAAFRGSTLYDWLRARDARTRVLSVSPKDRGAILPVGRAAGDVYWWSGGRFTTSRWYADELPAWVREFNARPGIRALRGRRWDPLLPPSAYAEPDSQPWERRGRENAFPHFVPDDTDGWLARGHRFPWIDSLTLSLTLEGVRRTGLGRGGRTDLLSVSLAATDWVGHDFGPDSRELHDHLLRLDRWLGGFLDSLAVLAPGGVVLALTSDHGVQPWPEAARSAGRDAGRVEVQAWVTRTRDSLAARWGTDFGLRFDHGILLADLAALRARGVDTDALAARLATGLRSRPGIAAAWSPRELAALPPDHELAGLWRRQLPPDLQWAAVATPREGWLWAEGSSTTGHETPALLDRAVPVVFWGVGVPARRCDAVIRTVDIAPTLAALLRVAPTESLDGTAVPLDRCGRPGR
ncbi:MAG TPA: alkaline phosphatase family protein, partial [Gemmatimonadales bacterium]|nr:alkaline phosphatase family protein [Gemmatimonadales bacterium]